MRPLVRRLLVAAASAGLVLVAVEVAARLDVRKRRAQRSALGDLLYRRSVGEGRPVVFLSGLQGSTRFWGNTFDPLSSSGHRLLFIDALGFGRSPWPAVEYTLEDHLGFLRRTLVDEGATSRVTVVGYSLGALLASEYAAAFPRDVVRLVLLGAPVFRNERDARARLRDMSSLGAAFSLSPVLARESCQFICALRPVLIRLAPSLLSDLPDAVAEDTVLHYWGSFHGTVENVLLRTRLEDTLRRLPAEVEVVLVHGRRDTVTDLSRIRELSQIGGARLVVVEGGHRDYVGHAGLISEIVRSGAHAEMHTTP